MTEKKLNIHQRINAVMAEISYVKKENKKVNNQYTFVSHDAVTARLHEQCVKHGINIIPTVTKSDQTWTQYEDKYENNIKTKFRGFTSVVVDVSFINVDEPNDKVTISTIGYGIDEQDKGPGKAMSYACKYAMLKVFMLETGDDPERDMIAHKPKKDVTKLKQQMRDLSQVIKEATDIDELDTAVAEYSNDIAKAETDLPEWFTGYRRAYADRVAELSQKDEFGLPEIGSET